jgi:hypothetical protein
VRTAGDEGWEGLRNGELLRSAAAAGYGAFVTTDRNLAFQQNLGDLPLPVITVLARSNRLAVLAPLAPDVLRVLGSRPETRVYVVGTP